MGHGATMLMVDSIVIGLLLGWLRGGSLRRLAETRLRFEGLMVTSLLAQLGLPQVAERLSLSPRVTLAIWVALMCLLVGAAAVNWRRAGMVLCAVGVLCNLIVIVVNGGMPVSTNAISIVTGGPVAGDVFVGDPVHLALETQTRLPLLADAIPLPGPSWHRGVISVGDILLMSGVMYLICASMVDRGAQNPETIP